MAEVIPQLNAQTLSHMTSGEKRLARRLEAFLEDDYLVWFDIPLGKKQRYPDFIILHPSRGLLFLEVKDWKLENLKKINKKDVSLLTPNGLVTKPHPLDQARQCTYAVLSKLQSDPQLVQPDGKHKGNLAMPYGWGVVFTNITRKQMQASMPADARENLLPDHLVMYKNEMTESMDPESFQEKLWNMFNYNFNTTLSLPQINSVRWHLFPEIRIDDTGQTDLFSPAVVEGETLTNTLPDIVKILDVQQEQLARSLGNGHRVIHGVSGSGKTLILGYRCMHLAQLVNKPILVLCFNITLAAKLRAFITSKGIEGQVQVYHFHDWCGLQLKTYHVKLPQSGRPIWEQQVESVISGVESGEIPRAQYGALLIDEGHDFKNDWLKLVVQMIDPEFNSLLLLYDDAQSIYKERQGLGFSLSSVGIQAQGRTTILRLNYRNTREILEFSYEFAKQYLNPYSTDEDHIPLVLPEAAGTSGPNPIIRNFSSQQEEVDFTVKCLRQWNDSGVNWGDMAVLHLNRHQGAMVVKGLSGESIPFSGLNESAVKKSYNPDEDLVTVVTMHSSKGLEFDRVIVIGIGSMSDKESELPNGSRLLYVAMTRAKKYLLMTTSKANKYSKSLFEMTTE